MNAHEPLTVLVTGGGGFLGKAIVRRLAARGDRVRSFSRSVHPELTDMGVEQITGDIADRSAVFRAVQGADLVFHTAAKPPPWGAYRAYHRTNVLGTENVLAGCAAHGAPILVHTSTPSVVFSGQDLCGIDESAPYPDRYTAHYPSTKAEAERRVIAAGKGGLRTIILRPHQIWGPGDPHFAPRMIARARRLRRIGTGDNLVDTLYIDNAADAHLLAADKLAENPALSGKVYFISQGEPIAAWDMIDAILAAAGLGPVKGTVSFRSARTLGAVLEFVYRAFHLPGEPPLTRFIVDALAKSHWFDIGAARKDLGYTPRVSTQEGLARLKDGFRKPGTQPPTPITPNPYVKT